MKIRDLMNNNQFEIVSGFNLDHRDIKGVYSCDLLSWVMSHANKDDVWITVQAHANVVAVASLLELSCIIIVDSAPIDEETIIKAEEHNIPILVTDLSAYEVITLINKMGL